MELIRFIHINLSLPNQAGVELTIERRCLLMEG